MVTHKTRLKEKNGTKRQNRNKDKLHQGVEESRGRRFHLAVASKNVGDIARDQKAKGKGLGRPAEGTSVAPSE